VSDFSACGKWTQCPVVFCGVMMLAACQAKPVAVPVAQLEPQVSRVEEGLRRLPKVSRANPELTRTFFATIRAAGQRVTASGVLQYYGPRDFRIAAITEMGVSLFDVRMDWGGVHVRRHMDGLTEGMVEMLVTDLSRAFEVPEDLEGLSVVKEKLVVKKKRGDGRTITWMFDAESGELAETDVDLGLLDTLRIEYGKYGTDGLPRELHVQRRARAYEIFLSFTDKKS
jgi:hypothetical protein